MSAGLVKSHESAFVVHMTVLCRNLTDNEGHYNMLIDGFNRPRLAWTYEAVSQIHLRVARGRPTGRVQHSADNFDRADYDN